MSTGPQASVTTSFASRDFESDDGSLFSRDLDGQLVRLEGATQREYEELVTLTIDGREVRLPRAVPTKDAQGNIVEDRDGKTVPRRTTIFDAAQKLFVRKPGDENPIPTLCHQEHMRPVGVCRVCMVEVRRAGKEQDRGELVPACWHRIEPGMIVHTVQSPEKSAANRVEKSVSTLVELLAADHLRETAKPAAGTNNELEKLAKRFLSRKSRFNPNPKPRSRDQSSARIAVDHGACILCDRCVRACDEVKENLVIGRSGKGYNTKIGFDLDQPMGASSCVSCGECMIYCPTDALTYRGQVRAEAHQTARDEGTIPSPQELKRRVPLFASLPDKFLDWNTGAVRLRKLKPGDLLCKEGEYGTTAFVIAEGRFRITQRAPRAKVKSERASGLGGWLGWVTTRLVSNNDPETVHKDLGERTAESLLLGEMTCMNHYPRSATVTAVEPSIVYEINRNILYYLQRNPVSRSLLDTVYRKHALQTELAKLSFLRDLGENDRETCVNYLRDKVELIRVNPGQNIFRQGDVADHLYIVRLGFVKVSQSFAGGNGERVLDYMGPGRHFGEIGLLSSLSDLLANQVNQETRGRRTGTCSALDDVELVRIRGDHFRYLIETYPSVRRALEAYALSLLQRNEQSQKQLQQPLGKFLDQGLFNAQKLLVLDLESCTRCDECTRACADTHSGVTRLFREGLRFDKFLIASSCRSCMDPYCLVGCPVDAIHRKHDPSRPDAMEIVIEDHCIGCGLCANNCPYGNINMHSFQEAQVAVRKATTCDLCRDVVGPHEDPSCVFACPHNAAFRLSGPQLMDVVQGTLPLDRLRK